MRLIDGDAFDKMLANAQSECKKSGGNFRYGVLANVRGNLNKIPSVDAVPLDKLCEWLCAQDLRPCTISDDLCERHCQGYMPSIKNCWKNVITKWMEGLDEAD